MDDPNSRFRWFRSVDAGALPTDIVPLTHLLEWTEPRRLASLSAFHDGGLLYAQIGSEDALAGRPSWRQNFRREPGGRGQLALSRHDGLGFQSRSSNASRRETLTGSSPVCMLFRKNEGQAVLAPLGEGFLRAYQSIHGTLYRSDSVGRASSNVRLDIGVPGFEAPREGAFVWQSPAPGTAGREVGHQWTSSKF